MGVSVTGSSMGLSPLPWFHSCPEHEKQNAFTTGPVLLLPAATHDASTSFPPGSQEALANISSLPHPV